MLSKSSQVCFKNIKSEPAQKFSENKKYALMLNILAFHWKVSHSSNITQDNLWEDWISFFGALRIIWILKTCWMLPKFGKELQKFKLWNIFYNLSSFGFLINK